MKIRRTINSNIFQSVAMTVVAAAALVLQPFTLLKMPDVFAVSDAYGTLGMSVLPSPSPTSERGEYVKIGFVGEGTLDLTGWKLSETQSAPKDVYTFSSGTLSSGQSITLCAEPEKVADCTIAYSGSTTWNNGGDAAVLRDSSNVEVLRVSWSRDPGANVVVENHLTIDYRPAPPVIEPSLSRVQAYYAHGAGYTGIAVDFETAHFTDAAGVELRVHRASGDYYSITAKESVVAAINSGAGPKWTTGTVVITGARESGSWNNQVGTWLGEANPTSVEVVISREGSEAKTISTAIISETVTSKASVFAAVPSLQVSANYVMDSRYGGISTEVKTPNLTNATGIEVTVNRTNGTPDVWTNRSNTPVNALNAGTRTTTAPIVIVERERTRTSSDSWQTSGSAWANSQAPESVTVRVSRAAGPDLVKTVNVIGSPWGTTWADIAGELAAPEPDDTTPPTVRVALSKTVINSKDKTEGSNPLLTVTAEDASGIEKVEYKIMDPSGETVRGWRMVANGTPTAVAGATTLNDGEYVIRARAFDTAGNKRSGADVQLRVDTTSPELSVHESSPAEGSWVKGGAQRITLRSIDANGVSKVALYIHNADTQKVAEFALKQHADQPSLWYADIDTTRYADGKYTLSARAMDMSGNAKYFNNRLDGYHLFFDNSAPAVPRNLALRVTSSSATVPMNGLTRHADVTASWQAGSDEQVTYEYRYWNSIDSSLYTQANPWRHTTAEARYSGVVNEGDGTHYYCVAAVDRAGNTSACSAPFTFRYDGKAPATTLSVSPVVNGEFTVSGDASDAMGLNRVYVQLVSRSQNIRCGGVTINLIPSGTSATWSHTYRLDELTQVGNPAVACVEGEYAAHVAVTDMAGNTMSTDWTKNFTVEYSPTVTADYFTVHDDHLGVGFSVERIKDARSVTVKVYNDADQLIAQNTGTSEAMLALLHSHTGQLSSPFYLLPRATDGYWEFGEANWFDVKPAYAVVSVAYGADGEVHSNKVYLQPGELGGTFDELIARTLESIRVKDDQDIQDNPASNTPLAKPSPAATPGPRAGLPARAVSSIIQPSLPVQAAGAALLARADSAAIVGQETPAQVEVLGEEDTASVPGSASTARSEAESDECMKFLGLCWYWWAGIVLVAAVAGYMLLRSGKQDDDELPNQIDM